MRRKAEIVREYGPFEGIESVNGVTYDGTQIWFASGKRLHALDPGTAALQGGFDVPADAGSAFDGKHLYQLASGRIQKLDPRTGEVLSSIPAPAEEGCSGLTWAEGALWVGEYGARRIHQIDPDSGAVLRSLDSDRFVTGVTWIEGELWHATLEEDCSELRRIDPQSAAVLEVLELPAGAAVSGLESDGDALFFCGGADSGKLRAVRRPSRRRSG
jgi:streptogramin lyase